ncbi:MAG: hypothetical protein Q8Q49_01160, partial [bacterium]|nr:hypothetical protein [bacterium]
FSGEVFIDTIATSGAYSIKLKTPRYLSKRSPGFITITDPDLQETFSLLQTTLVVGDSNDDNSLDILDYNMLIDCFSISAPPKFCSDLSKKLATDLNDDGSIDGVDVNLFVRNVTTQTGD